MAEWKKIIVSGSDAHLNQVTASATYPFKINTTNEVGGLDSTVPLVYDGTTGLVGTGSAYAAAGSDSFVAGSGLTDNVLIVGNGNSSVSIIDAEADAQGQNIVNIGHVKATTVSATGLVTGANLSVTSSMAIGQTNGVDNVPITLNKPITFNGPGAVTSSVDFVFDGLAASESPIIEFQSGNGESAALKDRIVFKSSTAETKQYSIQTTDRGEDFNLSEFKILNNDTTTLHAQHNRVGIGGSFATNAALNVTGNISGSGTLVITGLGDQGGNLTVFDKTLIYDSTTGTFGFADTGNVGGVTSVTAGTNINVNQTTGAVTVNLDTSLANMVGIHVVEISGSDLRVSGSGTTVVSAQHITASNLLVEDSSIFEGTFLFNGLDFTVQNASTFSGSNQFGSGSMPSDAFHEFTGSVGITGSLSVDGGFTIDDLTVTGDLSVDGTSNLDNTDIDGTLDVDGNVTLGSDDADTLTVNAVSTFNENVELSTANLNVGGFITGSKLKLTATADSAANKGDGFLVRNSTTDVIEYLTSIPLSDTGITAGPGIAINTDTISVASASMNTHFNSASLNNVSGDVTFTSGDNNVTFTAAIGANVIVPGDIAFIDDGTVGTNGGDLLISQGDGTYLNKTVTGVIAIDNAGVTTFGGGGIVEAAGNASASIIETAGAAEHSIVLTDLTTGDVSQSLKVDSNSNHLKYNTNTNILTVSSSTFGHNVTVGGNLTVLGDTVTMNTETLLVEDNFIGLNSNYLAGGANENDAAALDAGIQVGRGSDTDAILAWSETYERWAVGLENMSTDDFSEANAKSLIVLMDVNQATPGTGAPNAGATNYRRGQMRVDGNKDIWMYVD